MHMLSLLMMSPVDRVVVKPVSMCCMCVSGERGEEQMLAVPVQATCARSMQPML